MNEPPVHDQETRGPGYGSESPHGDGFAPVTFGHEEVLRGRSKKSVGEGALVLQAMGIEHAIEVGSRGARIIVSMMDGDRARAELHDYDEDNDAWPPPVPTVPSVHAGSVWGAAAFVLLVVLLYPIGQQGGFGRDWWSVGRMHAGGVVDGEIWRTLTALTLHVDLQHLISNVIFGSMFGILAAQALGTGTAWLGTVLAGAMGNWVESYLVRPEHLAVGASTAIFGTLGLLAAAEWSRRGQNRAPWVRRVAPLFGGVVLFGWLGVGDGSGRVDVMAHATGFVCGAALGIMVGLTRLPNRAGRAAQWMMGTAALILIAAGWAIALTR
ncbi:MAG: rhomboid protease GluP [Planctomycetota bacterium]|jgi:rhomboid protease GluP